MRMLLDDKYDIIDNYMSDSNVGCRRERGIRDHLSIVNRVIHKHCNSKNNPITIQVLDYQSCFDSLWQDKVTSELFDAVVTDDKLALLHRINERRGIRSVVSRKSYFGNQEIRQLEL